jgi:REP element-mobilizing transposase RayT
MNKYDPNIHQRRSIRLKGYDYSQAGAYFITICTHNRICRFGEIVGAGFTPARFTPAHDGNVQPQNNVGQPKGFTPTMQLNEYGQIAYNEWAKLPERFSNFELDVFQIMPNHIHGIIVLNEISVGAGFTPARNVTGQPNTGQPQGIAPTIGDIVGAYKSLVANECLTIFKNNNETMGKLWQRNYHEHIIRDEQSYQTISEYIINNPTKWQDDKFYSE